MLREKDQILVNLIKNSIKFTESGTVSFGYTEKNQFVEFFVKDSGIGIDSHFQNEVFDRFSHARKEITQDFEGSGLGLSISKAYVEMLGGEIWVKSKLENGTIFYFTIEKDKSHS